MSDVLRKLFEEHFHAHPERVEPLHGHWGASGRKIFRLSVGNLTAIGVLYGVREENVAFLEFSRHFRRHELPVPEIYAEDLEAGAYLEEDLGDTTLFDFLSRTRVGARLSTEAIDAYQKAVDLLPHFQIEAGRDLNYEACYPRAVFDGQSIAWDLNYFKYYFLKLAGVPFNEQALEDDFSRLTKFLLSAKLDYFLYRDFQSRNIMLREGDLYFVDYQGGRKGALQYDLASLLYDSKADLPPDLRQQLLDRYLSRLSEFDDRFMIPSRDEFMRHYYAYAYIRIMQALGAYGFRGFYERKSHFLQSVPYAINNVRWLLENAELPLKIPALLEAFQNMTASDKLQSPEAGGGPLVVRIYSFSYRVGIPRDETGHGGGFVFDARGVPNPGREERFKPLTGKDAPVIEYLERQETARRFLTHASSLVEESIEAYQRSGFTSLAVAFGCTGGRHRSVYFAEQLAKKLAGKPGLKLLVRHLELENLNQ